MIKKLLYALLGVSFVICSCVDKKYDLANKEITTDIKLEGNKIALPVGNLKPVILDSLVNLDEIEIIKKDGEGVYGLSISDTIAIEEEMDTIKINIDPMSFMEVSIDFDEVNIDNVHLKAAPLKPTEFTPPYISLDKLNEELPTLEKDFNKGFDIPNLETTLDNIGNLPEEMRFLTLNNKTVSTGDLLLDCEFNYELPKDVASIATVKLGTKDDSKGSLVNVEVKHPDAFKGADKSIDFIIEFPEMFRLERAENTENYLFSNNNSTITVKGLKAEDETTTISFYISELTGIDKMISEGAGGKKYLKVEEEIKYKVDYTVDGTVKLKEGMKVEDFSFDVNLNSQLSFVDASGSLNDTEIEFENVEMHFEGDFDDLDYIDKIVRVEFDETKSSIKFKATMEQTEWIKTFKLKEGYRLKMKFPDNLTVSDEYSNYEGKDDKVIYNPDDHAFYIADLNILVNSEFTLALKNWELNQDVKDGKCHIDVPAEISFVDNSGNTGRFELEGCYLESMITTLNDFNTTKTIDFSMEESDLVIKDAVVQTTTSHAPLNNKTEFKVEEEIPSEIERIERIDFKNDVNLSLSLNLTELDELDGNIDLKTKINIPSFLKIKTPVGSSAIKAGEGILELDTVFNPSNSNKLEIKLKCSELDFMTKDFEYLGLEPEIKDGTAYLLYDDSIRVTGDAYVRDAKLHSEMLDNNIKFNVEFNIDEIVIKSLHGKYNGAIDGVETNFGLLNDDLAFLRDPVNTISLVDPQIKLELDNNLGVPIGVNLDIFGVDYDGNIIGDSRISGTLDIKPAAYNPDNNTLSPVTTKIFINSVDGVTIPGHETVVFNNLANLLKQIPDSISLRVEPFIKDVETHHIDLLQGIDLGCRYSVNIPFKLNKFNLCYTDTIQDLAGTIGETLDMFSNVSLKAKMNIINTIPLGLELKVVALDKDAIPINDDIEIKGLNINPGLGGCIVNNDGVISEQEAQAFEFSIGSKTGDLSKLDKLAITIVAKTSDSTVGGVALKGDQGIKISDIVLEVAGDVEVDLGELGEDVE